MPPSSVRDVHDCLLPLHPTHGYRKRNSCDKCRHSQPTPQYSTLRGTSTRDSTQCFSQCSDSTGVPVSKHRHTNAEVHAGSICGDRSVSSETISQPLKDASEAQAEEHSFALQCPLQASCGLHKKDTPAAYIKSFPATLPPLIAALGNPSWLSEVPIRTV